MMILGSRVTAVRTCLGDLGLRESLSSDGHDPPKRSELVRLSKSPRKDASPVYTHAPAEASVSRSSLGRYFRRLDERELCFHGGTRAEAWPSSKSCLERPPT